MACYYCRYELFNYCFAALMLCSLERFVESKKGDKKKKAMSVPTWRDCFIYAISYGRFGGHLPFSPQTRFNIILSRGQMFLEVILGVRMFMTIVRVEKGVFLALMFLIYVINIMTRLIQLNICAARYREYFSEVDDFLKRNEINPITGKKNHFIDIWNKEKPQKLVWTLLVSSMIVLSMWYGVTVYSAFAEPESSRPLYWSPFYDSALFMRYFWALQEIFPGFSLIYLSWYLNMTFTSLITFQYAQLLYVKELAIALKDGDDDKDTDENMLWWYKAHQQVLGLTYKLIDLLALHALSGYFAQVMFLGLSTVLLLFENVTQTESQKVLCLILGTSHVTEFGYNCIIADRWDSVQNTLRDVCFTKKLLEGNKWRESAHKIFLASVNKPLIFTCHNFVILNSPTFRGMMMNIFSLYTSLRSVVKSKKD